LFQKALDHLQVSPREAVFIGNDRYRDVFGARQLGMKTVLFCHSEGQGGPHQAEPDYLIREFAELPRALKFFEA
jgi:putative hydrolase of the HAD superfamily